MSAVDVKLTNEHELTLEWDSSASNDIITDLTLALITEPCFRQTYVIHTIHVPYSTNRQTVTTQPHSHSHSHPHADTKSEASSVMRIQRLAMFLEAHFGEVELHMPDEEDAQELEQGEDEQHDPSLIVRLDEVAATINLLSLVRPHFFHHPLLLF